MESLNSKVDNSIEDQIRRDDDHLLSGVELTNFQFSAYLIYSYIVFFIYLFAIGSSIVIINIMI
jgi:hypothetical protein